MLRISKKADYAVFLLGAIARQGAYPGGSAANTVVSAHEVAKQAGLNKSVVANLLKEFSRHGLLNSVRGLRGGYSLAHPPSAISLCQIIEVVEGKFSLVDCVPQGVDKAQEGAGHTKANPEDASHRDAVAHSAPMAKQQETADNSTHSSCALIGFCPSKRPMQIVHQRIQKLFAEIHLDELCSMTPVCSTTELHG